MTRKEKRFWIQLTVVLAGVVFLIALAMHLNGPVFSMASLITDGGGYLGKGESEAGDRKLIVRVKMELEVSDLKEKLKEVHKAVEEYKGYIHDSRIYREKDNQKASMTIMVPHIHLEKAVARFEELGNLKLIEKTTQDVTRKFIDHDARLKNLRKEEQAFSGLLEKAEKVEDIIKIEKELNRVRTEVEKIEGELRFLERETAFSRVDLDMAALRLKAGHSGWPIGHTIIRAREDFIFAVRVFAAGLIYLVFFSPFLLVLYLVLRLYQRFGQSKGSINVNKDKESDVPQIA